MTFKEIIARDNARKAKGLSKPQREMLAEIGKHEKWHVGFEPEYCWPKGWGRVTLRALERKGLVESSHYESIWGLTGHGRAVLALVSAAN